jgi:outer membrane biosynthesis protein TonB
MFVDVSPAQATAEPPKDAKFYSDKNSQAANPQADQEANIPKITGKQTDIVKTEDVPPEKFTPLQPSPPTQPAQEEQAEIKPKTTLPPGDITLAKPDENPKKGEGEEPRARPRRLAEVQKKAQDNQLPGEKMKQEGGVRRTLAITSVDAKVTPYGDYDKTLIDMIADCWYGLLRAQEYASDYRGKVVLQFHLHSDGRITDMAITENTAGTVPGYICQTAVDKPNPYPHFPADMRRVVGETRSIQFTFYYY